MVQLTDKEVLDLFPELEQVTNKQWVEKACAIWREAFAQCGWSSPQQAQFNQNTPGVRLLDHTRAVTQNAIKLAGTFLEMYDIEMDMDTLITACVLHDVCKILEFQPGEEEGSSVKTSVGKAYQHGFLSAYFCQQHGFPEQFVSMIIGHTSESRLFPQSVEALMLIYADTIDAEVHKYRSQAYHVMALKK